MIVVIVIITVAGVIHLDKHNDEIESETTIEFLKIFKISMKNRIKGMSRGPCKWNESPE
jgi:hypothetical protein